MAGRMLRESLAHRVKELYSAEQQQARLLPRLVSAASSSSLRRVLALHLRETTHQAAGSSMSSRCSTSRSAGRAAPACSASSRSATRRSRSTGGGAARRRDHRHGAAPRLLRDGRLRRRRGLGRGPGTEGVAKLLNQSLDEEVAVADELLALAMTRVHVKAARATGAVA